MRGDECFVIFDEFVPTDCPIDRLIANVKARRYRLDGAFGDPAGGGSQSTGESDLRRFAEAGIVVRVCTDPRRTRVLFGVQVIQSLLLDALGRRRLFLATDAAGRCRVPACRAAFEGYAWPEAGSQRALRDDPVKDGVHDHPLDAIRYWAIGRLSAGRIDGAARRRAG